MLFGNLGESWQKFAPVVYLEQPADGGGGGGAGGEGEGEGGQQGGGGNGNTLPETIQIGDRTLSRAEAERMLGDYSTLQTTLTQRQQENAELKGRLEERQTIQQNGQQQTREEEPPPDFDSEWDQLDPYAEDFKQKSAELRRREREHLQAQAEQAQKSTLDQVDQRLSRADRARAIDAQNHTMFNRFMDDESRVPVELTAAEREAVWRDMARHVGGDYGEFDETTQRYSWNETAVEAALWNVPSVREKILAQERATAREEGLRARAAGEEAGRSAPGNRGRGSGQQMSFAEKVDYVRGLSPEGQADFARRDPEFAREYMNRRQEYLSRQTS